MSASRWQQVEELFAKALEQPVAQRAAYVAAAVDDPEVSREVLSLLEAHEGRGRLDSIADQLHGLRPAAMAAQACFACGSAMPPGARFCPHCGVARTPVEVERGPNTRSSPHPPPSWPGARADFRGTPRFRLLRRLGSGGMGIVYAAEDRERHEVVALKTLLWADPAAVYRLKKEFRSLADVVHPNLVALYELVAHEDNWFFTMELVDGVTFLDYLRQSTDRVERLRAVFRQIVAGVAAIHAAGKLHRDLKPSNVLVTRDGRAVILDFGIAGETATPSSAPRTVEHGIWGTIEYMAPEQADGAAVPKSDWYALGVMLYQALTGKLPFAGTTYAVLSKKWGEEPPRPDSVDPTLPVDLVQLCVDLMARAASDRPDDAAVLDRVGAVEPRRSTGRSAGLSADAIVGRERHLSALHDAFHATRRGTPVRVYVHGLSGSGKSTLIRHFLHDLAHRHRAVILQGYCYVRESVPYKGLDAVIDSLSRFLRSLPDREIRRVLTPDVRIVARLFPVLERVEAVQLLPEPPQSHPDPDQLRREGVAALRRLLIRLCTTYPVVIHIDDLQWGDADSVAVLHEVLGATDAPPLLVVMSFRSEDIGDHPFLKTLLARVGSASERELLVGPLEDRDAQELAHRHLGDLADAVAVAQAIAQESEGVPFLIELMARYAVAHHGTRGTEGISVGEILEASLAELPAGARRLLETLAVAAHPLDPIVARDGAELARDERPLVAALAGEHLLRRTGSHGRIELYHDRIRETLVQHIPPERARTIHRHLIRALLTNGVDDPETLYEHHLGAGEPDQACNWAIRAGERAWNALAFERAAEFYTRALTLASTGQVNKVDLRTRIGEALAEAGRGVEAAEIYLEAVKDTIGAQAIELRRRAADELLRCGDVERGVPLASAVLEAVHLRWARSRLVAAARLVARRAYLRVRGLGFRPRRAEEIDPAALQRLDVCWTLCRGLVRMDNLRAEELQSYHLLLALRTGEPYRVTRALAAEAAFVSLAGGPSRHRALRLVEATRTLAEQVSQPHALAWARVSSALVRHFLGEFSVAAAQATEGEQLLREGCKDVWYEIDVAQDYAMTSLYYAGDLAELARRVPAQWDEAVRHGDRYALADIGASRPNVLWLMRDDPAGARDVLKHAFRPWVGHRFHLPHWASTLAENQIDLYVGDAAAARERLAANWAALRRSMLLRVQVFRVEAHHLRARCALAFARHASRPEAYLREAERDAQRVAREQMAWSNPLADLLMAGVHATRGDDARAIRRLIRALTRFETAQLGAYAAAARSRYGQLLGGAEGASLMATAEMWMREAGVANPARMTAVLAPGFED